MNRNPANRQNRTMLIVDLDGDRRSQAILAQIIFKKLPSQAQIKKRGTNPAAQIKSV